MFRVEKSISAKRWGGVKLGVDWLGVRHACEDLDVAGERDGRVEKEEMPWCGGCGVNGGTWCGDSVVDGDGDHVGAVDGYGVHGGGVTMVVSMVAVLRSLLSIA